MSERREVSIHVPVLARVEGEGALELRVRGGRIEDLKLRIFEPPRLFEKLLEGRDFSEVPDLVARICGICPVAYQMSAVQALESTLRVDAGSWVRSMRRVFYCGEWIQSHSLHIHLLAAPDFLGYASAIEMARDHPELVRRGLRLQSLGNALIRLFGARSVHPVGACVGGFHYAPRHHEVDHVLADLEALLPQAEELLHWTAGLDLPADEQEFVSVALRHAKEYPMYSGRIVSNAGLDIAAKEYEQHFREFQVPHSTALHSTLDGAPYLVGPLARLNLNHDRLCEPVASALKATGIAFPSRNMFHSIVARAVEILLACHEAKRLLEGYEYPPAASVPVQAQSGTGYGATEAPRGLLWHRYQIDAAGHVTAARIVPPTSQNQARIEADLRRSLQAYGFDHSDEALRLRGETVIRNYDPCISCATHFLDLRVKRESDA